MKALNEYRIDVGRLRIDSELVLGRGGFGVVKLGVLHGLHKGNEAQQVAIKHLISDGTTKANLPLVRGSGSKNLLRGLPSNPIAAGARDAYLGWTSPPERTRISRFCLG